MDFNYLYNLSNNNTLLLNEQLASKTLDEDSIQLIKNKYNDYVYKLRTNNWQELKYDNFKLSDK
jgi:hypothetical protein